MCPQGCPRVSWTLLLLRPSDPSQLTNARLDTDVQLVSAPSGSTGTCQGFLGTWHCYLCPNTPGNGGLAPAQPGLSCTSLAAATPEGKPWGQGEAFGFGFMCVGGSQTVTLANYSLENNKRKF